MRVAYLTNQYPKVSHTFIRREIRALERQGVDVLRFALRGWDAQVVDSADKEEQQKTRYTLKDGLSPLFTSAFRCLVRRPGAFWQATRAALAMAKGGMRPWPYHLMYLAQACRISEWLEKQPVTHLHAHFGTNPAEIAHLVNILGGPGYSFTIHGMDEADNARQLALGRKVAAAKFVVAISAFTRSQLMRHADPGDWSRIKVVHCGLPAGVFDRPLAPFPADPVFLSIGRLSPEKGHLILLEAFAKLRSKHPAAKLVIAGGGELQEQIETRIRELALGEYVRLTGWIDSDQVRAEIDACRFLVQPSLIEGLPVVIMEAMAQSRPVISTYVAGIPELVRPGETGWLVPAGDTGTLVSTMEEALKTSDADLVSLGLQARTRAAARHNIDTEATRLRELFAGVED